MTLTWAMDMNHIHIYRRQRECVVIIRKNEKPREYLIGVDRDLMVRGIFNFSTIKNVFYDLYIKHSSKQF